jgi:hypothetical protein
MVMRVIVGIIMTMGMVRVGMIVMVVSVIAMMVIAVIAMIVIAMMDALLRLEAALDGGCDTALAPRQFSQSGIVLDVESLAREFREAVLAAQVPGEAHETERVFGAYFQKLLGGGPHLDKLAVLEPQGVAVVDHGLHVEVEMDVGPRLARQMGMAPAPLRVIERDRIDNAVELDGGFTDDGGDAGHDLVSWRRVGGLKIGTGRAIS